ncbi:MAG: PilZ domain-containing protein [Candidatus Omnitrophota bacterium]
MRILNFIKPLRERRIWERRKYPRVADCLNIDYKLANDIPHSYCVTRDISEGGVRLNLYQRMKIGTVLKLGIDLKDFTEPAWVIGKVVWAKETPGREYPYEAGIEFSFLANSFRSRIQNHIVGRMNDSHKKN